MDDEVAASLRSTPPAELKRLARSQSPRIRVAVATNAATPTATLELLAGDIHMDVRAAVAHNQATPLHVVTRLALDDEHDVAQFARAALVKFPDHLSLIAASNNEKYRLLAAQIATSPADLLRLTQDTVVHVRQALASRTNVSWRVLLMLMFDENDVIRSIASSSMSVLVSTRDSRSYRLFNMVRENLALLKAVVDRERTGDVVGAAVSARKHDSPPPGSLGIFVDVELSPAESETVKHDSEPSE